MALIPAADLAARAAADLGIAVARSLPETRSSTHVLQIPVLMATGNLIPLRPRTSTAVDLKRLEISNGAMRVQYDLDMNAPSQRYISDCCQGGGVYEAAAMNLLTQVLKPGDTFVDVGAHVGFFSMMAAALVGPAGRVVAFEPNADNYASLRNNVSLNGYSHVVCVNSVVGDRDGEAVFFENLDNDGGHGLWDPGLHPFNELSKARQQARRLPITTLDTALSGLGVQSIKAVKIDTEGAEVQVLKGGARCLAAPEIELLVCEDNEFGLATLGTSSAELRRTLEKLGFAVRVQDEQGQLREIDADTPFESVAADNFYCFRRNS
jgi:FkbM family methyltransferase